IAVPLNGAITLTAPGNPPAWPCVEPRHAAYCAAWQDAHRSVPANADADGAVGTPESTGAGNSTGGPTSAPSGLDRMNHTTAAMAIALTTPSATNMPRDGPFRLMRRQSQYARSLRCGAIVRGPRGPRAAAERSDVAHERAD